MAQAQMVVFWDPKLGSTEAEWEDCAGHDSGGVGSGTARCIVVDGATEAYDSVRWVRQLVGSFLGLRDPAPGLGAEQIDGWIARMQQQWVDEAPATFATIFEERKFHDDGSFATMLGCELDGLAGPTPGWSAVALGDTVLFHVRGGRLVAQFPPLRPGDFGLNPEGVFTKPETRDRMRANLLQARGRLEVGDLLFVATDAFAEWVVRTAAGPDGATLWALLARLDDPAFFARMVADRRAAGEMKNDDVTLLRAEITPSDPDLLVVNR